MQRGDYQGRGQTRHDRRAAIPAANARPQHGRLSAISPTASAAPALNLSGYFFTRPRSGRVLGMQRAKPLPSVMWSGLRPSGRKFV